MTSIIDTNDLSESDYELAIRLNKLGVLPFIESDSIRLMGSNQFFRLKKLVNSAKNAKIQSELFPFFFETGLGEHTLLYKTDQNENNCSVKSLEVLIQLLPFHLEKVFNTENHSDLFILKYKGSAFELKTNNRNISELVSKNLDEFYAVLNQRAFVLSRSANYQGSKAVFTPAICALVNVFSSKDDVVLDLMCGAGSVSGALSHYREVITSDAQYFSRYLAKVQGGGIDRSIAKLIISQIRTSFTVNFDLLISDLHLELEKENEFLSSEITETLCKDFIEWVSNYPRVGNENSTKRLFEQKLLSRGVNNLEKPGVLFTSYYANLFFGVLQAAEIDCIRTAIFELDNSLHRQWALGALTATVSYCAYSYAGHFAQPKMRFSESGDNTKQIIDIFKKRNISVLNEFSVRLLSLAEESEKSLYEIQDIPGPWKEAILKASELVGNKNVFVYFDPPYTRDEFSRYYHVLETLIHYNYPEVTGKASIPLKGSVGRFSSNFFSRNVLGIENLLVEIILECLNRKWTCLWSYSSSGMANIGNVLQRLEIHTSSIEIFSSNHSYAPQGKQKSKHVIEYFIVLIPSK